ncbi:hypothetical protein U0070_026863, partial [Myodes glareolus]
YEYTDYEDLCFDSYIVPTSDLKPGELRLLEVDNRVVLPIELPIRILISSEDVYSTDNIQKFVGLIIVSYQLTDIITYTSIPNYIYWLNKLTRSTTSYIYSYNTIIYKPRYSNSTMSRSRTPISLIPILIIIETISLFIQPIALAVRLTANITQGFLCSTNQTTPQPLKRRILKQNNRAIYFLVEAVLTTATHSPKCGAADKTLQGQSFLRDGGKRVLIVSILSRSLLLGPGSRSLHLMAPLIDALYVKGTLSQEAPSAALTFLFSREGHEVLPVLLFQRLLLQFAKQLILIDILVLLQLLLKGESHGF